MADGGQRACADRKHACSTQQTGRVSTQNQGGRQPIATALQFQPAAGELGGHSRVEPGCPCRRQCTAPASVSLPVSPFPHLSSSSCWAAHRPTWRLAVSAGCYAGERTDGGSAGGCLSLCCWQQELAARANERAALRSTCITVSGRVVCCRAVMWLQGRQCSSVDEQVERKNGLKQRRDTTRHGRGTGLQLHCTQLTHHLQSALTQPPSSPSAPLHCISPTTALTRSTQRETKKKCQPFELGFWNDHTVTSLSHAIKEQSTSQLKHEFETLCQGLSPN